MSESTMEEIISLLGFAVAALAYIAGFKSVAVCFLIKAVFDAGCAIYYGYKEVKAETKPKP